MLGPLALAAIAVVGAAGYLAPRLVGRFLGAPRSGPFALAGSDAFNEAPPGRRAAVRLSPLVAGYVVSAACFFAWAVTTPHVVAQGTTMRVVPGQTADLAGLRDGDMVLSVAGTKAHDWDEVVTLIRARQGQAFPMEIRRGTHRRTYHLTPSVEGDIGASVMRRMQRRTVGEALVEGLAGPPVTPVAHGATMARLFGPHQQTTTLGGPVAIVREAGNAPAATSPARPLLLGLALFSSYAWWGLAATVIVAAGVRRLRRRDARGDDDPQTDAGDAA